MSTLKRVLPGCLSLAVCLTTLVSCGPGNPGSWKNAQIKPSIRSDFHQRNDEIFGLLKQDDAEKLKSYESADMVDNAETLRQVERISNHLKKDDYVLLDEYYVVHKQKGENKIASNRNGVGNYNVGYTTQDQEMYFAFWLPKVGDNKWMISTIWTKYNYGWKLSLLDLGKYTINGKTAPELLKFAKEEYQKKYLVNAANAISLASQCSAPCQGWKYAGDHEIDSLNNAIMTEANEKVRFPCTLASLPGQPRIVSIFNEESPEGTYPAVYYITHVKLSDTTALRKENDHIKAVIGHTLPGIDKDKKFLFYSAFNEMPSSARSVKHYDMVQKIE